MKNFLLSCCIILIVLFFAGIGAGYFYGRAHLNEAPGWLRETMARQQISLEYQNVEIPGSGLSFSLLKPSIAGEPLLYTISADRLTVGLKLTAGWPPIKAVASMQRPVFRKNPGFKPAPAGAPIKPLPDNTLSLASVLLSLSQFELGLTEASAPDFGITRLDATVDLKHVALSATGIKKMELAHDILIGNVEQATWLTGVHWRGDSIYENQNITARDQDLAIGPFVIQVGGRYDLTSGKWSLEGFVPKTTLGNRSKAVNSGAHWLKSSAGEIELKLSAQGMGADTKSINAEGKVFARGLKMNVDHQLARGEIKADIESEFSKGPSLNLKGNLGLDLTDIGIAYQDLFLKPRGIPLAVKLSTEGKDGHFNLSKGELKFNNLSATANGEIVMSPEREKISSANVHLNVSPTSLVDWEQFFPKYSKVKAQGTIEAQIAYNGPLQSWQQAQIDAKIKIQKVRFPLLKEWIASPPLEAAGVADLHSITELAYGQGVLRAVSTETELDLTQASLTYGELFQKPVGTLMTMALNLSSNAARAEIKRGEIQLGKIRGQIRGGIENLRSPEMNFKLGTERVALSEIFGLLSVSRAKYFKAISGTLAFDGTITGPLSKPTAEGGPQLKGTLDLNHLAMEYGLENAPKKIRISDAHGPIWLTSTSLSTKNLALNFPNTDAQLDLQILFQKPEVSFGLRATRFSLNDFFPTPSGESVVPAGVATIPVAGVEKSSQKNGFISDPLLKTLKANGVVELHHADLGWTRAETFSARLAYEDLRLKLDPVVIKTLNGTITSGTLWDGRPQLPTTLLTLRLESLDANPFLTSWSSALKDVISGKLSATLALRFKGMTTSTIKEGMAGDGSYRLSDAEIRLLPLVRRPLDTLKAIPIPGLASLVTKLPIAEKFTQISGKFQVEEGKFSSSGLSLTNALVSVTSPLVSLDRDQRLQGKLEWAPTPAFVSHEFLEPLRDSSGKPGLPLVLQGTLQAPVVVVDQSEAMARIKAFGQRKVAELKSKPMGATTKKLAPTQPSRVATKQRGKRK